MMGSEPAEPACGAEAENVDESGKESIEAAPGVASVSQAEKAESLDSSSPPSLDRKASTEDSAAIIESLRARLLSERNSSRAAKQQAQQLARKVKELERGLEAEIEQRKRCEEVIQELIRKLEEAGVKVEPEAPAGSGEDPEQSSSRDLKPKWTIGASRRNSSSDASSVEGDTTLNSNAGEQSPSSSPVSDTSLVPRRVGRSCRTVRRKESWETSEVDEQVKGSWSKVGEDMVEISKLRDEESGWVSRAVDVLESKDEGSWSGDLQEPESQSEKPTELRSEQNENENESSVASGSVSDTNTYSNNNNNNADVNSPYEASTAAQSEDAAQSSSESCQVETATQEIIAESSGGETSSSATQTSKPSEEPVRVLQPDASAEGAPQPNSSAESAPQPNPSDGPSALQADSSRARETSNDSVHDILRALRLAKEQLRGSVMINAGASPGYGSSRTMWQPGKTPGYSGLVVTRPLAQFVPATGAPAAGNEVFQMRSRSLSSHHSYVVDNSYFTSSPSTRF